MPQLRRTVVLWVVLIALFAGFYVLFDGRGPSDGSRAAIDLGSVLRQWLPFIFLFLAVVFFLRRMQGHGPINEGVRLLWQGRYVQALQLFETYRKAFPNQPVGAFNAGSTRLQLWKLEAALADLQVAEELTRSQKAEAFSAIVPEHLALTFALLGREGDARASLAAIPEGKGDPGRVGLVQAILLARAGDFLGARGKLSAFEVKQMSGTVGAFARTLDAMCIERTSGELRHVDRVALFGEAGPDELRKAWPEFVAFVDRAPAW